MPHPSSKLHAVCPVPRLLQRDSIDVALCADHAWQILRHGDLARAPIARALFALRTLPSRLRGRPAAGSALSLDQMESSAEQPGFRILVDDPPREVVAGAIGKVWHLQIPFVHIDSAEAFTAFRDEGFIKVAWAVQVEPLGQSASRVTLEVRVDATDDASWQKFRKYFAVIGPASHFIRRSLLATLARDHGAPSAPGRPEPLRHGRHPWRASRSDAARPTNTPTTHDAPGRATDKPRSSRSSRRCSPSG